MRNKNFENIKIQNTSIVGANFVRCNLSGSYFDNVDISGMNIMDQQLQMEEYGNKQFEQIRWSYRFCQLKYVFLLFVSHYKDIIHEYNYFLISQQAIFQAEGTLILKEELVDSLIRIKIQMIFDYFKQHGKYKYKYQIVNCLLHVFLPKDLSLLEIGRLKRNGKRS